jgi:two-component system, cell cycle response regulator
MIVNIIEDSDIVRRVWQTVLDQTAYRKWRFWSSARNDVNTLLRTKPELVILRGLPKYQDVMSIIHQLGPFIDEHHCKLVVASSSEQSHLTADINIDMIDAVLPMPFTVEKVVELLDTLGSQIVVSKRERPLAVIVDDSPVARKLICQSVQEHDFDTLEAGDGLTGLKLIGSVIPDIVLADIEMPGMNGLNMCEKLAKEPKTAHIPVIIISAIADTEMTTRGFSFGAVEFLKKPFTSQQLANAVSSVTKSPSHLQDVRAFVLEDSYTVASVVRKFLRHLGVRSMVCTTIAELYANLEIAVPDFITVDLTLPDGSGLDVCRHVRSNPAFSNVSLIVVSGDTDRDVMVECLEVGADDYIVKPFVKNEFYARIKNILRTKRLQNELQQKIHMLENLAFVDGLTGLFNRLSLDKGIKKEIALAVEQETDLSLCLIDLDDFKKVNDTHGHDIGDEVLREVSEAIRGSIRATDIACRYGGEEICVIFPGCDIGGAYRRAVQICEFVSSREYTSRRLNQTVSIGVSAFPAPSDENTLIKDADTALYEAKRAGKDCVFRYGGPF